MIGFFESAFSPIIIFLLGSWYTKTELAKRVAIWHITGFFGQATSGMISTIVVVAMETNHARLSTSRSLCIFGWTSWLAGLEMALYQ